MTNIVVYQKPTCSTCRRVLQILKDRGAMVTAINYYETPFTATLLRNLLTKAGLKPREVLRMKETIYKTLRLANTPLTDDELIRLMVKHPDLIQRPLVSKGDRVLLARPPERVESFL